jgi:mono/diheme cytochrome c family protein
VKYDSAGSERLFEGRAVFHMPRMLFILLVFALLVSAGAGQQAKSHASSAAKIARGKYLVEDIGKCADCHSPRNEKGEFIKEQWLKGTVLDFKPTVAMPVWADKSVDIAGLPGWEGDAAIKFFMTGIGYNGLPPRPPMPQYRYNQQDAEAVVAYLKSLEPRK